MEFILNLMPWIWGCIAVATIIIELETSDLDAIWFSIGSIVALIVTLIWPNLALVWQLTIFISVTIVLLLTLGRWAKKKFRNKNISTNADALVGKELLILEDCNEFDKGSGLINGVVWTTICKSGHKLQKNDHAIIVAIDGNKLVVQRKENEENE